MEGENDTIAEAEASAAAAVQDAANLAAAGASETVAHVVERAAEQIDEAHEQAAEIVRAAMETELGRQIAATNTRIDELWRDVQQSLQPLTDFLQTRLPEIEKVTTATAVLALLQSTPPTLAEPPAETVTEAAEAVTEILPEAVAAPVESTPAAPPPPAKRKRFL